MRRALLLLSFASCTERDAAAPSPVGAELAVTATEIRFGGDRLMSIKDALRDDYPSLLPLDQRLRSARAANRAANPCAAIVALPDSPFAIIRRVMHTCQDAGFPVAFELGTTGSPRRLALPRSISNDIMYHPRVSVMVSATEVRLLVPKQPFAPIAWDAVAPAPAEASDALAALKATAVRLSQPGEPLGVLVQVDHDVPLAHLAAVHEALAQAGLEPLVST